MSIRVMVVDDEPIAAQGTSLMVRKADLGLEVVALCYSGRDAVTKADLLHPDIIVMDIQMSGINGLEAMRRIRESSPHASFIILSAYSEFSYAVEALTLGASDYLLKPVKQVNFTAALQKVAADILARKEGMDLELQQQERLQIAIPMIQKDFIRSLLPGAGADERLLACASFLGLTEQTGFVAALGSRQDPVLRSLEGILDSIILQIHMIAGVVRPNLAVVYIPIPREADGEGFREEIRGQLDRLLAQRQMAGERILAGAGSAVTGPLMAKYSLLQALGALEHLHRQEDSPLCCAGFDPAVMALPEDEGVWDTKAMEAPSSTSKIIERATAYIEENYHRELSLDEVASFVNLSPYYFSRLFKEYAGANFSEVLLQARIGRAKELLADPHSSVKDVAYQVGYNDPNYFSKVFRKATGIRASDYRDIRDKMTELEEAGLI